MTLAGLLCLLAAPPVGAPPAGPVRPVDWRAATATVLGVGTPRILSPTGSLLERDAIELAREDAFARLRRLFRTLPRPEGRPPAPDPLVAAGERAAPLTIFGAPVFFADGTAHMTASVSLPAALGLPVPPATARIARVGAPSGFAPCIELRLEDAAGATALVGLPGDAIPHLRYREAGAGAVPTTSPRACTLKLPGAMPAAEILEVELP